MKILSVCSARPNFIKLAAINAEIAKHADYEHCIVHTGQHYDPLFSDVFFEQLKIAMPKHNLGIHADSREETIAQTKMAMLPILEVEKPDIVFVYGDVNGAVGAAQAAHELHIPIAHIEAGLRSFDTNMPEELNRIAIDQLASMLFCTEQSGIDHLKTENITTSTWLVGNTMIDTLINMQTQIAEQKNVSPVPKYIVTTMHRPSNVDTKQALQSNMQFLERIAQLHPIVLPLHHRLKTALQKFNLSFSDSVHCIEPLGYLPFLRLIQDSVCIVTDSGGIQEEAVLLQKRCFTIRRNTERPSTIEVGSNTLIDPKNPNDVELIMQFLHNPQQTSINTPPFWDGKASARILEHTLQGISQL